MSSNDSRIESTPATSLLAGLLKFEAEYSALQNILSYMQAGGSLCDIELQSVQDSIIPPPPSFADRPIKRKRDVTDCSSNTKVKS